MTPIEWELTRELQAAGFLVVPVSHLRPPYEHALPILVRYVDRSDLPLGTVLSIADIFKRCRAARRSEFATALLRAYANHPGAGRMAKFCIAEGIAATATKKQLPEVLAILGDPGQIESGDPDQPNTPRCALVTAIWRLMGRKGLGLWRELLNDPEIVIRGQALLALGRLEDRESLPRMREAASAVQNPWMQRKAAEVLHKLERLPP